MSLSETNVSQQYRDHKEEFVRVVSWLRGRGIVVMVTDHGTTKEIAQEYAEDCVVAADTWREALDADKALWRAPKARDGAA